MATDDERREVAERLRECKSHVDGAGWFWLIDEVAGALIVASSEERLKSGANRIADLIEPSCDREALLALADEMDHPIKQAVWNQTAGVRREHIMSEYARRIREACGEVTP